MSHCQDEPSCPSPQTTWSAPRRMVGGIPIWKSYWRKMQAIRYVSASAKVASQLEFLESVVAIQRRALESASVAAQTIALWKIEKLAYSLVLESVPEVTLVDERIPAEVQPICHAGLGIAAIRLHGLNPARINSAIESWSHPEFRHLAYESIGTGWVFCTSFVCRLTFGLIIGQRLPRQGPRERAEFLSAFPVDVQRLIWHGYGRASFFESYNLTHLMRIVQRAGSVDRRSAIGGAAFAYAMVNHANLNQVLDLGQGLDASEFGQAFQVGLVYALCYWEWAFPGFLNRLVAGNDAHAAMLAQARNHVDSFRSQGTIYPPTAGDEALGLN